MSTIIGQGAIASRFASYAKNSEYLIFAGSVHDSSIEDIEKIQKEEEEVGLALASMNERVTFVYFSSCSLAEEHQDASIYINHKKRMEDQIRSFAPRYIIFRLPQVIGFYSYESGLVNHLVDKIFSNEKFNLWENASRNFIDLDDVYSIVDRILSQKKNFNCTLNVASSVATPVVSLVRLIEKFLGKSANFDSICKGDVVHLDVKEIGQVVNELNINFDDDYLPNALNKYYSRCKGVVPLLSLIVPTYNQEFGIHEFYRRAKSVLKSLEGRINHEFIFINDYSSDQTFLELKKLAEFDSAVRVINFSRNFGNQIAITAGIEYCRGDLAVIIDDDLQDPPEVILDFLAKWYSGYDVVYGVRPKRSGINPFFKMAAKVYYRTIGLLSDTKIPNDTGDFRLIDKVVIDQLKEMKEENRYYRGMVAWVGFRQVGYTYERDPRYAGKSNFSFGKYLNFALNGLTSFTDKPLYFSSMVGFFITGVSFLLAVYIVINKILNPEISIQGWTSLITIIMFFGGVQLFSIGILGVYISKVYREVKRRPLFIVQEFLNFE